MKPGPVDVKFQFQRIVLEKIKKLINKSEIDFDCMVKAEILEKAADVIAGRAYLEIYTTFFGKKTWDIETVSFKYPRSPWHHFKECYFPAFLKKIFPVKYAKEDVILRIEALAKFPMFKKAVESGECVIELMEVVEMNRTKEDYND